MGGYFSRLIDRDKEMTHHRLAAKARYGSGRLETEAVRVRLLGGFGGSVGPRSIDGGKWRLQKAGSLVKLLALAQGHRLHREQVMETLWPDLDTKSASNNLHRTLHTARRILVGGTADPGFCYLRLDGGLLSLCPDGPLWIDVEGFEAAAAIARRGREPAAYRAALELYAGELLPEDRYEEWAQHRREELRQLYLTLLFEMAEACEERGEYGEYEAAVEALRRVISEEPAREDAHTALMRLYALNGRRHEATRQYERLRIALSRELGTEPAASSRLLFEGIRAGGLPALPSSSAGRTSANRTFEESASSKHNLSASLTSFVGRELGMVEVKRLLSMTRLLTLTGAGGSGKTRLAREIARDLAGAYPDGAWLVELAPLSEPALAPRAVATALCVTEQPGRPLADSLVDALRHKRLLMVLDNCEHLVEAMAHLAEELLASCPGLRVLATSRESLGVAGEITWPVPTLSLPDADKTSAIEDLPRSEAVRLFVNRARSRLPAFQLNKENAGAVARICRTLDGIPLAIELAAGRMGALAVEQVAERLEGSLALLAGGGRTTDPRHQTLRATLEWSHDLLSGPERVLFRRLSVFAGMFTLEAAEDVCPDEAPNNGAGRNEVLALISRLIDKSLVIVTATASPGAEEAVGYRLLEPIRQYGLERLEESGDAEETRERHARHYLALAEKAESGLIGAGQVAWLERLTTEYANLRAALGWCLDQEDARPEERARMGLRLAAALGRFWGNRGTSEGGEWLEKGLARSGAAPASLRAKALREAGFIAIYHLDPRAIAMLEEALALFKGLEDELGRATSINNLMHAVGILGYHERLPTLREEAEALLEKPLEDRRAVAHLQLTLGMMAMIEQDHEQVVRIEEALTLFREAGDVRTSAMCLTIMGIAALGRGEAGDAARAFEDTLHILQRLKDKIGTFYSLTGAAGVAVLRGHPARAARLFGAAEALRKAIGHPVQPLKRVNYDYESFLATTREALSEADFEAAFSEGHAMSPEQAIEYALSTDEPAPPAISVPQSSPPTLTCREQEVALLLARGLTNRQIASELSISEHTVAAHLRNILKKLGLRSRTQIPPSRL